MHPCSGSITTTSSFRVNFVFRKTDGFVESMTIALLTAITSLAGRWTINRGQTRSTAMDHGIVLTLLEQRTRFTLRPARLMPVIISLLQASLILGRKVV